MDGCVSVVDLLRRRAQPGREGRGYTFLLDGGAGQQALSFAALDERARAVAAALVAAGAAGQRVLLLYPPGLDYVVGFFGCLYAGAVAVPVYPPRPDRPLDRFLSILRDARPRVALATDAVRQLGEALLAGQGDLVWLASDRIGAEHAADWVHPGTRGDDVAFLQYTSGSTADPKGVRVTHGNLLHNETLIQQAFGTDEDSVVVGWLPLYHDMGLIGNVLHPLHLGGRCVLMSPLEFLRDPLRWLVAIDEHRGTVSGGPNFAFDLCVRKADPRVTADLDLSTWRVAFNGAEPVRPDTMRRFAETFAPCGFDPGAFLPCYGLAEGTLLVSAGRAEPAWFATDALEQRCAVPAMAGDGARELAASGRTPAGCEVRIVDPETRAPVPAGGIGEIWARGDSVADGYWERPEVSEATFGARTTEGDGPWLRTGDLGFCVDGALFVTGRIKDLLVLRGRNHYPQDLERTAERAHPALRPGCAAAFSVDRGGEERAVVVVEVQRRDGFDAGAVIDAVRAAVSRDHELGLDAVVLIAPRTLPKTSSGKVRRQATRAAWLAGELDVVGAAAEAPADEAPRSPMLDFLRGQVAAAAGVAAERVGAEDRLSRFALDSLQRVELARAVELRFAVRPDVELLFGDLPLAALAEQLQAAPPAPPEPDEPPSDALSEGQRALWFLHRLDPDGAAYHVADAVRIGGALHVEALVRAFDALVARHVLLRSVFPAVDGEPVRRPAPRAPRLVVDAVRADALADRLREGARAPFRLDEEPPLRARLLCPEGADPVLLLVAHHIATDLASQVVLVEELGALYRAEVDGVAAALPPARDPAAAVARQARTLAGPEGERLERAWMAALEGELPVLALPTRPRPPALSGEGRDVGFTLDAARTAALRVRCREHGVTPFVLLLAAFQALLHRYTGQRDLLVGTVGAGRSRPAWARMVGYFVNPLPLRARPTPSTPFSLLLDEARAEVVRAFRDQDLPFSRIVERKRPERQLATAPVFQAMFVLQQGEVDGQPAGGFAVHAPGASLRWAGLTLAPVPLDRGIAQFDLSLTMAEHDGQLRGTFDGPVELWAPEALDALRDHFCRLLDGVLAQPDAPLAALPLLSDAELRDEARDVEATARPSDPRAVQDRIVAAAAREPDAVAVRCGGDARTWRELAETSARWARALVARGVGPERVVALRLARSAELPQPCSPCCGPVARGCRWTRRTPTPTSTPSSPTPAPRWCWTTPRCELADVDRAAHRPPGRARGAGLHLRLHGRAQGHGPDLPGARQPRGLLRRVLRAGRPRPHPAADLARVRQLRGRAAAAAVRRRRRCCPPTRRSSTTPVWPSASPPTASRSCPRCPRGSRAPACRGCGSCCPAARPWPAAATAALDWVSGYGLTETTICSTFHRLSPATATGRPPSAARSATPAATCSTTRWRPCPPGSRATCTWPGSAWRAATTATRARRPSASSPTPSSPGRACCARATAPAAAATAALHYVGRADRQVKVRGHRIELAQVEAALLQHPEVSAAVVALRRDALAAWVVARRAESRQVLGFLRERLPEAYVPPRSPGSRRCRAPSGKVDVAALPDPVVAAGPFEAPRSEIQRRVAEVWAQVLGLPRVGVADNFFDLGGHSLLLAKLHAALQRELGSRLSLVDLFRAPTVAAQAARLQGDAPAPAPVAAPVRTREPLAIVGVAGRFPGAADPEALWRNLVDGVEGISVLDEDALRAAGVDEALLRDPSYVRAKGVLGGIEGFDAAFFGYSPREAELMDPQQRLFLECAWEALEDAGHPPGGRVGVFGGSSMNTYLLLNLLPHMELVASLDTLQASLGNDKDLLTSRVSYKLGLTGPSVTVQTASSTSLAAVHVACEALLAGTCDMALAGGASVHVPETSGYRWQPGGTTARDGHCRAYDADSTGFVSGNGAAVVLIKRLSDAVRDRDHVRAVILGSACNNDGADKVSWMAPSVDGQATVIREALAAAGVAPSEVTYLEGHGTGTAMGDPIEVAALNQVFGGAPARSLPLGSLKSNLGHLDTAAGVCGLLKAALCVERAELVPTLHFRAPNPRIDFEGGPLFVNTEHRPWTGPRVAGVTSLGMGGTNAHVVLGEAPAAPESGPSRGRQLLVVSARTPAALDRAAEQLAARLAGAGPALADVAFTLAQGRRHFEHRRAVVAADREEAVQALRSGGARGHADGTSRSVAFLFPGQGAQHAGMGRGLYETEPVYRAAFDEAADRFAPLLGRDLRQLVLGDDDDALAHTDVTQPALFAVERALAVWLQRHGLRPDAMVGHSLGEYVAAHVAGVLSLDDAVRIVAARGRLMQAMPPGAMIAVDRDPAALALPPGVEVAAVNQPGGCVLTGPASRIEQATAQLTAQGATVRRLRTSHAFHSALVAPAADALLAELAAVTLHPPRIPFLSNVTGTWITDAEATDPRYWARQLRAPVRFADAAAALLQDPGRICLEVGPGRTLAGFVRARSERTAAQAVVTTMRHPREPGDDAAQLLRAVGAAWAAGAPLADLHVDEARRRVPLPTYPFERARHWVDPPTQRAAAPERRLPPSGWTWAASWLQAAPSPAREPVPTWLCGPRSAASAQLAVALGARHVDAPAEQEAPPERIVWVLGPEGSLEQDLEDGLHAPLALVRSLAARWPEAALELCHRRRGRVRRDGRGAARADPRGGAGLPVRVLPLERPSLRCRLVDPGRRPRAPWRRDPRRSEPEVALRGRHRWVPAHVPAPAEPAALPTGTWLVTGGLGGIGQTVARALVARGANVVLVGRSPVEAVEASERWRSSRPTSPRPKARPRPCGAPSPGSAPSTAGCTPRASPRPACAARRPRRHGAVLAPKVQGRCS
ncbi:MAG: AMP-binding protein [Myxococcota bacterium]